MTDSMISVLANAGVLGIFFWWATQQLIPQLKQEREASLASFERQMEQSRILYRDDINKLVVANEKAVEGLLEHMKDDHLRVSA